MEVYPLRVAVLNIGRRADNHLIIDDPRISRVHAQLRLVRGRFVIFDLESSGGTWVNGERIHQRALQPGDVISLSGVPLVFGQDSHLADETQRMLIS
jgi:pSer/pThr/pTyr-binding forkhead associated (FHA) protein